jgi:hypothetical protein
LGSLHFDVDLRLDLLAYQRFVAGSAGGPGASA